jgi:hypothetical protein
MKTVIRILFFAGLVFVSACRDYLDIVPDGTMKMENIFSQRAEALNALARVYSYIPNIDDVNQSSLLLGDEWIGRLDYDNNSGKLYPIRIARGLQTTDGTLLGLWSGSRDSKKMYEGIRQANLFLQYIDIVPDMTDDEKAEWSAQVKFLKAYYHFLLLQQYGPIVIADELIELGETSRDKLFPKRAKIEECFDYIINLMNETIPQLTTRATTFDLGQVDQVAAKAIKARVLLFRASPFYNGNQTIFGDFFDHDGQHFFPQKYDKEKWKDVIDAVDDAITTCIANKMDLYKFSKVFYVSDTGFVIANPERMQTLYDLRLVATDPWNKELVWGKSNLVYKDDQETDNRQVELAHASNIRLPSGYTGIGNAPGGDNMSSGQWLAATYKMAERYYTKNGLPIDEDLTFDESKKHNIVVTPGVSDPGYADILGIMQPGVETINLYLNRELRFYANLGITGGYFRAHRYNIKTTMYYDGEGGRNSSFGEEYLCTGIGVQKFVHPESGSRWSFWQIPFPYPIIRMADLYLMKAEALNEYYDSPNLEVYEAINTVRRRAGIPDVQAAWSSPYLVREESLNKHTNKDGMRDIILQERSIELAFEGSRYWDMVRHKRAITEFSDAIMGWNTRGQTGRSFFVMEPKQNRKFTITDYLWPIDLNEMNTNGNLIQNPGW